jgi:hypothetical protein
MTYYEKGTKILNGLFELKEGLITTDLQDKVATVIAAIIVLSPVVALLVGVIALMVFLPLSPVTIILAQLAIMIILTLVGALLPSDKL